MESVMDYLAGQEQQSLSPRDYATIICVFGSRTFRDKKLFHRVITEYLRDLPVEGPVLFLSGAAPNGPDDYIIQWCHKFRFPCLQMPAQWQRPDGSTDRGAGFKRNTAMSEILTRAIGFWDEKSHGTKQMIEQCVEHVKPLKLVKFELLDDATRRTNYRLPTYDE